MKKHLLFVVFMLLLSSSASSFVRLSFGSDYQIVRVPDDYPTIQQAVNAVSPGSVVLVSSGVYHEHVIVNKSLELIGDEKTSTIIDSDNNGTAITVMADNVRIEGFTLRNASYFLTTGARAAIHLVRSNNCTVSNNILRITLVSEYSWNAQIVTIFQGTLPHSMVEVSKAISLGAAALERLNQIITSYKTMSSSDL